MRLPARKFLAAAPGSSNLAAPRFSSAAMIRADLILPVSTIAKAHKDGIVLKSGEKYHFLIANHTRDQVEAIFSAWLNPIQ